MYHPILSPSHTTSAKPFASHLYKFRAVSRSGDSSWQGLARVPPGWGTVQVRKALRDARPDVYILETSWAPELEGKTGFTIDFDFASKIALARSE